MRAAAALCLIALVAGAARAQEAADPIGDVLAAALPPDQSTDSAEEEAASPALATAPPTAPDLAPPPRVESPPRRSALDRPVMIGETGVSPDGPPTPLDLGYEARIRGSAQAAQGLQGPLDGGWTVRTAAGVPLMTLQLVDRGQGYGALEGAWRDLATPVARVGLIDSLDRQPVVLTIRITPAGRPTRVLTLTPTSDGGWTGDLLDEAGVRPVTMRRN
ncbi:MAG: hypothetical protein ACOY4K_12265 [Pseudomonadota bacterium]